MRDLDASPGGDGYLTVAEVATLLRVDRATMYTWMEHRRLPFQYVGTRRRVRRAALDAWLAAQTEERKY